MPRRSWDFDPAICARVYRPERVPDFNLKRLPDHVRIIMPLDGGFWLINRETGIRYRRITMADLPPKSCWANLGRGGSAEEDGDEISAAE